MCYCNYKDETIVKKKKAKFYINSYLMKFWLLFKYIFQISEMLCEKLLREHNIEMKSFFVFLYCSLLIYIHSYWPKQLTGLLH